MAERIIDPVLAEREACLGEIRKHRDRLHSLAGTMFEFPTVYDVLKLEVRRLDEARDMIAQGLHREDAQ